MKRVIFIIGTRPEAIKMAPVIKAFQDYEDFDIKICSTAQHRQMLDHVLSFFEIKPDYDLNLMVPNQTLNTLAGRLFLNIDEVFDSFKPNWVVVHGDTTTSSISAWAAFHRGIKVAHVEAGLRTYDLTSPFPEELNRQVTGRIATMHFAPTESAKQNLLSENVPENKICVTGNTVIDALLMGLNKIDNGYTSDELNRVKAILDTGRKLILVTGHRRESFGNGFIQICLALRKLSERSDVQIIYPVHLNPNVQNPVNDMLGGIPNIHLLNPLEYPTFIYLMRRAYIILTDSGGVQEEAPSLGKPVLVMRDKTERSEAIKERTAKLVGTSEGIIVNETLRLLDDVLSYNSLIFEVNPYGDGSASGRILERFLNE